MMLRTKGSFNAALLKGKKEATIGRCGRKSASQGFCKIRNGFGEHVFVTSSGQSRVDFHFREPTSHCSIETAFMPSISRGNAILLYIGTQGLAILSIQHLTKHAPYCCETIAPPVTVERLIANINIPFSLI
eukprot:scaffold3801_cov124-Skeletonema_dohrnii-CCMP3373.AAC.2